MENRCQTTASNPISRLQPGGPNDVRTGPTSMRARPKSAMRWYLDVLVVDDDPADTWLVLDALQRDPRVRGATGSDAPGQTLLDLASGKLRPDLILVDLRMPKVDGHKFVDALREIPSMKSTPVAVLTTSRYASDVETARSNAVCSYIVKPDTFEELQHRLTGIIAKTLAGEW